jgi:hypothetical protein
MTTIFDLSSNNALVGLSIDYVNGEVKSWQHVKLIDNYLNNCSLPNSEILFLSWCGNYNSFNFPISIYTLHNDLGYYTNLILSISLFDNICLHESNNNFQELILREIFRVYNPKYF